MSMQTKAKTNFTAGQISKKLYGRGDLGIYSNGAKTLKNVIIHPTGGVSRRNGLLYVDKLLSDSKLISFEFNTQQNYLLCFSDKKMKVYKNDVCIKELDTPWNLEHLKKINWTQSADTLLIVHPDVIPQQISRQNDEEWKINPWVFYSKDNQVFCPYYNFYQKKESVKPSGTTGNITITSTNDIFNENIIGSRLKINAGEVEVIGFSNAKTITVSVKKALSNANASSTWEEQAFSKLRGYPNSVTFHQDRMVIGGSKSLPNRLWLSKSSDLFNFDIGTGLDDESIDFSILSDQVNAIVNIISSRHLLVFTTGAEWMVSGEPLTPISIKINRQTNVGSYTTNNIAPQNIDGATIFISQSGTQLREFLFADVEQAYQARDLTILANDVVINPKETVYNQDNSVLYIVLHDGSISCLTTYRSEEVNAWSKLYTQGSFISVASLGRNIYFVVKRGDDYFLEKEVNNIFVDCGVTFESIEPKKLWTDLQYLDGKKVEVVGDDYARGTYVVNNGQIELDDSASKLVVGLSFEHVIEPLPFMVETNSPFGPVGMRLIRASFRLLDSQVIGVDVGNGYYNHTLADENKSYSGDISLRSIGWRNDMQKPLWSIKSDSPSGFNLLSVVSDVKIKE